MSKYVIRMDTQYDYHEGEELYHVFERGRVNEWGEPYCVAPFVTYEQALDIVNRFSMRARPLPMNGTDYHHFGEQ